MGRPIPWARKVGISRVLVACEFTGSVRRVLRAEGYDAWSADLLPAKDGSRYHIQGDVLDVLDRGWDCVIGFPPCTYLCQMSYPNFYPQRHRFEHEGEPMLRESRVLDMARAVGFFYRLWESCDRVVLENPLPHKFADAALPPRSYRVRVNPWQFGDPYSKVTYLWLKNVVRPEPEHVVHPARRVCWVEHVRDWETRVTLRPGIVRAVTQPFRHVTGLLRYWRKGK